MKIVLSLLLCAVVFVMADPDGECPDQDGPMPIYLPDKELCASFYECSGGRAWLFNCSPGTYFNPEMNECEFGVNCGSRATTTTTKATPISK